MTDLRWRCVRFSDLTGVEMHRLLRLRQNVFVVEQECIYQDIDDLDLSSMHVLGLDSDDQVLAYARIVEPGKKFREPAVGRVAVALELRRAKLGFELMTKTLDFADELYPKFGNRISAQSHLIVFYSAFGYQVVSDEYDEDGIPHVEMLRPSQEAE